MATARPPPHAARPQHERTTARAERASRAGGPGRPSALWGELTLSFIWLAVAIVGFVAGGVTLWGFRSPALATSIWRVTLIVTGLPFVLRTLRDILRRHFAADVIASIALVVALIQSEFAAGIVIVLMLATGQALEAYGHRRASDALAALLARAPRIAHRIGTSTSRSLDEHDIPVEAVAAGDVLIVRAGDLIPVDGTVVAGSSAVDESALTGEPMPVSKARGAELRSGTINVDGVIEMHAERPASESEYAQVVRLMEAVQRERPAVQRTADRVAVWFTPFTLGIAGVAFLLSGDPTRLLAVLVVATPCPLILATPIAMIGGINRAARQGMVVKNGTALEALARVTTAVFDKTGTLTRGKPVVREVVSVVPELNADAVLALAASVEQRSAHLLARAVTQNAECRGVTVLPVEKFEDITGQGARGEVGGQDVIVGSYAYVTQFINGASNSAATARCHALVAQAAARAEMLSAVAVNGVCAGLILYEDEVRPGLRALTDRLGELGVQRLAMLTGDNTATAEAVAALAGIPTVSAELSPADKSAEVAALRMDQPGVLMVGDGINDAPALAAADVGIAMGARGAAISAAAADVVLLVDDVHRVADAIQVGKRTMRIVWECIVVGLGLSGVAMAAAALGFIHPVVGAVIQEFIDLAVVFNALRAR